MYYCNIVLSNKLIYKKMAEVVILQTGEEVIWSLSRNWNL